MKKLLLVAMATTCLWTTSHAQVGINTTDPEAILDVESDDSGILIPRVALTAADVAAPITTPTISELIYNTETAGSGVNAVTPGYYYWDGNRWTRIGGSRIVHEHNLTTNWYINNINGTQVIGFINEPYTLELSKPTLVEINISFDVVVTTADGIWPNNPQTKGYPILYGFALYNGEYSTGDLLLKDTQSHTARPDGDGVNSIGLYRLHASRYVYLPTGVHTFNLYLMGHGGSNTTPNRGYDITMMVGDEPYYQVILHD